MGKSVTQIPNFDVTCAGHLCLDITPEFADSGKRSMAEIFKPGMLLKVGPARIRAGGSVSNTGSGLKRLGLRVALMGLIGKDDFGDVLISLLTRHGMSTGIMCTDRAGTSYSIVIAPPGIDRAFLHDPGTNNLFSSEHVDYGIVTRSKLFHLGYPTVMQALYRNRGAELVEIFRKVKKLGVTTSLDLALADPSSADARVDWREIFQRLLPYVDLLLPSIEESFQCLYPEHYASLRGKVSGELIDHIESDLYREIGREFLEYGCGICMLKAGHKGLYLRTGKTERLSWLRRSGGPEDIGSWTGRELWCPAFKVKNIANATGAGDVSIAAFLSALLTGRELEQCLKLAAFAGYLNLQAVDTFGGLKSLDECSRLLKRTKPAVDKLELGRSDGWEFNDEFQIYENSG